MTQWLEQYVSAWGAWLDVSVVAGFGNESRISFGRRAYFPMAQESRLQAAVVVSLPGDACHSAYR